MGILDKRADLTSVERERFRMHPYFTERAPARIGPLGDLIPEAASHHEWVNGEEYHRGTKGKPVPHVVRDANGSVAHRHGKGLLLNGFTFVNEEH